MIIRNTGVRHGRRALAAPVVRWLTRPISMLPKSALTPAPTATATPDAANTKDAELRDALSAAMAFKRKREEADLLKAEVAKIPANFKQFVHIQNYTKHLGSKVKERYPGLKPLEAPSDATLEMLLAAQAHMGSNTSLWNPGNARYIYGVRNGIHIISLEQTAALLRRAARVVEEVAYGGGLILFVGTRPGQKDAVVRAAHLAEGCHLFQRWVPGTITNRDMILKGEELRVVDAFDQDVRGMEELKEELRPLKPDLVVCMNPVENYVLLDECGQASVPTIGVIDTDADPTWVTYQIPANDDSLQTTELIAAVLGRAGERGHKRRREDAKQGIVTWEEPDDIRYFKRRKGRLAEEERKPEQSAGGSNREVAHSGDSGDGLRDRLAQQVIGEVGL